MCQDETTTTKSEQSPHSKEIAFTKQIMETLGVITVICRSLIIHFLIL